MLETGPSFNLTAMLIGMHVVRNEADVLEQVLRHAAPMHDLILAVDVASTDGSGDVIRRLSEEHPHLVFLRRLERPVRAEMVWPHLWATFRKAVPEGSWWSIVDGDEFAHEDLRRCVAEAEAEGADHIQGAFATFAYTRSEAGRWRAGRETLADRERPVEDRRRYYTMNVYSKRLFREHPRLSWPEGRAAPEGLLRPLSRRIHYRHYQLRDLEQIHLRLATRQELDLDEEFRRVHYHWTSTVEDQLTPDDDPRLRLYRPGSPLEVSDELAPVWVKGPHLRAWGRLRAWWRNLRRPDPDPKYFAHLPVEEIVASARGDSR